MRKMKLFCCFALGLSLFFACSNDDKSSDFATSESPELDTFLKTTLGKDFIENFSFTVEDFCVKELESSMPSKDVTMYVIPLEKGNKFMGRVCWFQKAERIFDAIYEDWTNVDENGGTMLTYDVEKKYIATWSVTKEDDGKYSFKITETAAAAKTFVRTKSTVEFPQKGEEGCTAKCYAAAKAACDADPECKILCDLINAATGCMATLSIAAACAIYCNV